MRLVSIILSLLFAVCAGAANAPSTNLGHWTGSVGAGGGGGGGDIQLQQGNITYVGYFLLPHDATNPVESGDLNKFSGGSGMMWPTSAGTAPGTGAFYFTNTPGSFGRVGAFNIPAMPWNGQTATLNTALGANQLAVTIIQNSGDLAVNSIFTCSSMSGSNVLTVSAVSYGSVGPGYDVRGQGISVPAPGFSITDKITSQLSGGPPLGGVGTYQVTSNATSTASGTCVQTKTRPIINGALMRTDGNLLLEYNWYYPGGASGMTKNALVLSGSDLSTVQAWDQEIPSLADASQVIGMVGTIGSEWQSALGGSYLTGEGNIVANDSRGTIGPSAVVFDPNFTYGPGAEASATTLAVYPYSTSGSTIIVPGWLVGGEWPSVGTTPYLSGEDRGATLFIPHGFSSLMTVGAHGVGPYCYGPPTSDPTQQRVLNGSGEIQCYDLGSDISGPNDKGAHSYPYEYWAWLWNVSDLEAVKAGLKSPSAIYPYAAFQLPWPVSSGRAPGNAYASSGAGYYDQSTGYLYVLMGLGADTEGNGEIIGVWHISTSTTTPFAITTAHTLPSCTHGTDCSTTLASSGGTAPVTWKLIYTNPSYLTDLTLSTSGVLDLSSADMQTGTFDVMVEATDANGKDSMIGLSLTISDLIAPHFRIAANDPTYSVAA